MKFQKTTLQEVRNILTITKNWLFKKLPEHFGGRSVVTIHRDTHPKTTTPGRGYGCSILILDQKSLQKTAGA
jgi:hypothetical protein